MFYWLRRKGAFRIRIIYQLYTEWVCTKHEREHKVSTQVPNIQLRIVPLLNAPKMAEGVREKSGNIILHQTYQKKTHMSREIKM